MSRRALAAAVVVLAAFALYAPTLHDYFLQDDFGVVALFATRSLSYIPRWFVMPWTEDIWGYVPDEIRPFPAVSYVVTSWFGASAPEPNHLVNIGLHAANGLLVMWIAEAAAGLSLVSAAAAGLIFVVLPIQVESVGWVTGRVDSLPAFFYFASFLLYVRWVRLKADPTITARRGRLQPALYASSVALFFAALFTKQNTITMVPALVLFDWIVARRRVQISWAWLRPYVPYVVLTVAFLALRYVLFQEVARENALSAQRFQEFLSDSSRHLVRLVFGGPGIRAWTWKDTGVVVFLLSLPAMRAMTLAQIKMWERPLWRQAIYFGLVWLVLGMAPILVSGYYSPRHMYLASMGWAVLLGIALDILWQPIAGRRLMGVGTAVILGGIVVAYALQVHGILRDWGRYASISHAATTQIEREAIRGPEGTLVIAGVPRLSWAFAVPYSVRPPFTATDLTKRIFVISDSADHCCDAPQWSDYTRGALRGWRDRSDRPPVVALYWNPATGKMSRVSDRDDPQLRTLAALLLETDNRETLDSAIRGLLNNYVALR